jgi:hypothetical protein
MRPTTQIAAADASMTSHIVLDSFPPQRHILVLVNSSTTSQIL